MILLNSVDYGIVCNNSIAKKVGEPTGRGDVNIVVDFKRIRGV